MTPGAATYDHATAVADIIAGYYRTEMALRRDGKASCLRDELAEGEKTDRAAAGTDSSRPS